MAIYRRNVFCTKGHSLILSFDWDPMRTEGPKDYSGLCPFPECDGDVTGKLPVGTDADTLKLSPRPS